MKKLLILSVLFAVLVYGFEVQKPKTYDKEDNVSGWLMSEKLDGIRGYWNGKELLSQNGNPLNPPQRFVRNFPPFALDGELWTSQGEFEKIQSIVLRKNPSKRWKEISFNIFEVPKAKGDFRKRLQKAKSWFQKHPNKFVNIITQIPCKNKEHLEQFLTDIVDKGGEGVIVKNPHTAYQSGRSAHILKVKKVYDMEGTVTGHNLRNDGTLKSLVVQLSDKTTFNLGTGFSDKQRKNPPKIGDRVTFKYYGFTKYGKPKFASFLRVRKKE